MSQSEMTSPSHHEPPLGEHALTQNVQNAATAVDAIDDGENVDKLIRHINLLLDFHRKKSNTKPQEGIDLYWDAASQDVKQLKEFLTNQNAVKCASALGNIISCKDSTQVISGLLKNIGHFNLATAALLTVADVLDKFSDVSDNKDGCISLLDDMHKLGIFITRLKGDDLLMDVMENDIKDATVMKIVEGSLICSKQMDMCMVSRFLLSSVNKKKLQKLGEELKGKRMLINSQMLYCILKSYDCGLMRPLRKRERECPTYKGMEDQLEKVIQLLDWKSDTKAQAVILYGLGGMGKSTLADAVFARFYRTDCKYSMVGFDEVSSNGDDVVKLQKIIIEDLMIGAEDEVTSNTQLNSIKNFKDGRQAIGRILDKDEVLIYIDNVSNTDMLEKLLPKDLENAKKLRLLITTRDKDIRRGCRINKENVKFHRMECVSNGVAENFLNQELPGQVNATQLERIVNLCGGIPQLLNKAVDCLKYSIDNKKEPFKNVEMERLDNIEKYVFSYKNLPQDCRGQFLDICMFFNGSNWEKVKEIVGKAPLRALKKKALVSKDNMILRVDGVVLEMGKEMEKITRFRFEFTSTKGQRSTPNLDLRYQQRRIVKLGSLTEAKGNDGKIFEKILYVEDRKEVTKSKGNGNKPKRRNRRGNFKSGA